MATLYFTSMIGDFIGERVGIAEARQNFQSVMTAYSALMGIGGAVGGFLGLRKSKRGGVAVPGSGGNLMNSTQEMMSQGIKPLPNALAKRSGIIGLTGLAIGGGAAAVGGTVAGTKKAWHAGERSTKTGKLRGVARVAVAPVTGGAKAVGNFVNPRVISTAKTIHNNKINHHHSYLKNKRDKHSKGQDNNTKLKQKYDKYQAKMDRLKPSKDNK